MDCGNYDTGTMKRQRWNEKYREREVEEIENPSQLLIDETARLAPGKALDLAAGVGRNAAWLARRGWDVDAVDFSEVAVEKGRMLTSRHDLPVSWYCEDLTQYQPSPQSYDLVTIFYLQLPWDEMRQVVSMAAGAVKPGGVLLVVGHDLSNLGRGAGGPQDPAVLYTADALASELEGMEFEKIETLKRPIDHERGGAEWKHEAIPMAIDCVVKARASLSAMASG